MPPRTSLDQLEPRLVSSNHRSSLLCGSGYVGVTDTRSIVLKPTDQSCYDHLGDRSYDCRVDSTGQPEGRRHAGHRGLVQADVPPLDADGLTVAVIGTAAFTVALVVCWVRLSALRAAGHGDWLWICLTGAVLGLVGIGYLAARRRSTT